MYGNKILAVLWFLCAMFMHTAMPSENIGGFMHLLAVFILGGLSFLAWMSKIETRRDF